jgi:hypothetical protein
MCFETLVQLVFSCGVKDLNRNDVWEGAGFLCSEVLSLVVVDGMRRATVKLRTASLSTKRLNPGPSDYKAAIMLQRVTGTYVVLELFRDAVF